MRFSSSWLLMLAVAVLAILSTSGFLLAQESCRISVDTILAARNDAAIDPQLKRHIGELQSMFNYTSYRLLGSKGLNLSMGQSGIVGLPGGRRLKITPHKIRGNRADIALQMIKQKKTVFETQIELLNHGSLFVGGPKYRQGNLIFRISSEY